MFQALSQFARKVVDGKTISRNCLLGIGHFQKCPKLDCCCICHEISGDFRCEFDRRLQRQRLAAA